MEWSLDTKLAKLTTRIIVRRLRIKETCSPEMWAYEYSELDIPGKHLLDWLFIKIKA